MNAKRGYANYITALFLLILGMKTLDGAGLTYMSEKLMDQLRMSSGQYSKLSAYYYLSYSLSCILAGMIASHIPQRKILIAVMTIAVGVISICTSMVTTYAQLVMCRLATGLFQGGSMSYMLAIIAKNLVENEYGMRSGVINLGSSLISLFIGPIYYYYMAEHFRWNTAYLLTGSVILALGVVCLLTVREVHVQTQHQSSSAVGETVKECFHSRVFMMCFFIGILETVSNLSISVFRPLYYTEVMGYDSAKKALFISAGGMAYLPVALIVPMLADRFPVQRVMLATFVLAWIAPAAVLFFPGTELSAVLLAALGGVGGATVTLFTYMIPRYALPERLHGFSNGVILGVACLIGGTAAPAILGDLVDRYGWSISQAISVTAGTYLVCMMLSAFLRMRPYARSQELGQKSRREVKNI
ncbi:MAG: MFS transporter [Christensenellales bacterium]|nr:MFS transporter [Christensenellales bacterium]